MLLAIKSILWLRPPLLLLMSTVLGLVLAGDPHLQHQVLHSALIQFPVVGSQLSDPKSIGGGATGLIVGILGSHYGGLPSPCETGATNEMTAPAVGRTIDRTAASTTGVLMQIQFIASMAAITADPPASRRLYVDALGLPLNHGEDDDYYHSEQIAGSKHFGVWPLMQAAQACFGTPDWPGEHPVPQASIEFEVADADAVGPAAAELADAGFPLLHEARLEPWGQTVARAHSPEGLVIGISYAPWLH